MMQVAVRDSASVSTSGGVYLWFEDTDGGANQNLLAAGGVTNDYYTFHNSVIVKCGSDGNIEYGAEASGSLTLDVDVYYNGVQLR